MKSTEITKCMRLRWRFVALFAFLPILILSLSSTPQEWTTHTVGNVSLELPSDWKAVPDAPPDMGAWYTGDEDHPDAAIGVLRDQSPDDFLTDLDIEEQKDITIAGRPAVYYYGTPSGETGKGFVIVVKGEPLVFIGSSKSEAMMKQYQHIYDRIISSIKIGGVGGAPVCEWDSFTYDERAFSAQPGRVFPLRRVYKPGQYMVHVGPAGKDGLAVPPSTLKTFGPFTLTAGGKYLALIRQGPEGTYHLYWTENDAILDPYSSQSGMCVVYARNEMHQEQIWYAICLEAKK